ncbi:hypothetical protein FIBSPDRAFT_873350 [Athelia psychrophila]|uniref:Uncharacterized protein n=1 Tax=Athelia psychrophila TaxID=1759441 RepID=A0A165YLR9_9AGAM|nr:hypothetical protein FIBSPDRAFT_873350 [Fibularhizoctonia sp. CBS 109695]
MTLRPQSRSSTGSAHRTCSPVIYVSATQRPPDFFLELTLLVAVAQDAVVLPKLVTPARVTSNYIGTVGARKRHAEEDLQTLDGGRWAGNGRG